MRPRAKAAAPKTDSPASDPLADALLFLAAHHGRAISREALMAGLPVLDSKLPPPLFERAAAKAGLEGKAVRRKLADIPALVLPAVLSMRDGSTRILLAIDLDTKMATVVDPSTNAPPQPRPLRELNAEYLGFAFLVRPASFADARAVAADDLPRAHWFWSVARRFWSNYSHVAVAALVTNLLALASPLFIMNVYDRVVPNGAMASMIALSIGMGIAVVFDFVIRMVRSRIVDMTGKKLDVIMASNIFEHVLSLKMSQRPASVGILANQIREFDSVREFFTSGTVVSITDLLFAVLFIAVLFMIGGALAFIPLLMLPVMIIVGFVLQWPLERAMRRLQSEAAARHGVLVESLGGIETVRATGAEARMQNAWERSVAATARSGEEVHHWSALALTSASTAQQLNYLLMVIVGVFLILDGKITVGVLVASTMLSGRVLAPITGIATVITRAAQTFVTLKSINRIMQLERERPPERMYVTRRIEKGSVAFENVSFSYPGSNEAALDKVSFKVAGGERIAIIGRVGSGKTTIGRLLCGFYEPTEGKVIVDDVDARQYDPADLRTGVGFVLQDTDLFFGKIRDNIALGKPTATDEEIIAAARLAGVENFIAGHPLGYDMPIAEGGRSLSGGQKQAIGLARALIRRPKVLFLDEPTAHFDVRSEADFLERLKDIAADNMTILISTHRLSLLSFVDRILLFERGKLVADGPRDKVIAMLRGGPTKVADPATDAKGVKTVA